MACSWTGLSPIRRSRLPGRIVRFSSELVSVILCHLGDLYSRPQPAPGSLGLVPEAQSAVPSFCRATEHMCYNISIQFLQMSSPESVMILGVEHAARRDFSVLHSHDCRLPSRLSPQGTLGRTPSLLPVLEQRSLKPFNTPLLGVSLGEVLHEPGHLPPNACPMH
jgi:hypothetical protein